MLPYRLFTYASSLGSRHSLGRESTTSTTGFRMRGTYRRNQKQKGFNDLAQAISTTDTDSTLAANNTVHRLATGLPNLGVLVDEHQAVRHIVIPLHQNPNRSIRKRVKPIQSSSAVEAQLANTDACVAVADGEHSGQLQDRMENG